MDSILTTQLAAVLPGSPPAAPGPGAPAGPALAAPSSPDAPYAPGAPASMRPGRSSTPGAEFTLALAALLGMPVPPAPVAQQAHAGPPPASAQAHAAASPAPAGPGNLQLCGAAEPALSPPGDAALSVPGGTQLTLPRGGVRAGQSDTGGSRPAAVTAGGDMPAATVRITVFTPVAPQPGSPAVGMDVGEGPAPAAPGVQVVGEEASPVNAVPAHAPAPAAPQAPAGTTRTSGHPAAAAALPPPDPAHPGGGQAAGVALPSRTVHAGAPGPDGPLAAGAGAPRPGKGEVPPAGPDRTAGPEESGESTRGSVVDLRDAARGEKPGGERSRAEGSGTEGSRTPGFSGGDGPGQHLRRGDLDPAAVTSSRTGQDVAASPDRNGDRAVPAREAAIDGRNVSGPVRNAHWPGQRPAEVEVQVDAGDLGPVTVRVAERHGTVAARFVVEEGTASYLLQRNMPELQTRLERAGLVAGQLEVSLGGGTDRGRRFSPGRREPSRVEGAGSVARGSRAPSVSARAAGGVVRPTAVGRGALDVLM